MIDFDALQEELKKAKKIYDLSQDILLYKENCEALKIKNPLKIQTQLNKSVERYKQEILEHLESFGFPRKNVDLNKQEAEEKTAIALFFVTQNIPSYMAIRLFNEYALEIISKQFLG